MPDPLPVSPALAGQLRAPRWEASWRRERAPPLAGTCILDACPEGFWLRCAGDALPCVGLWQLRHQAKSSMGSSAALPCGKRPWQHPQFLDHSLLTALQDACPSSHPWPQIPPDLSKHVVSVYMFKELLWAQGHTCPWHVPSLQGHGSCQCPMTAQQH